MTGRRYSLSTEGRENTETEHRTQKASLTRSWSMTKFEKILAVAAAVAVFCLAMPTQAQPRADQVLTDMGYSSDDRQQVLNGQFVSHDLPGVSDKDLALTIAFLVKTSPADLSKQVMAGGLISNDSTIKASGEFTGAGSLTDLAGLQIGNDTAQALSNAQAGQKLNLSTSEISAFNAVQGQQAVQQQLQHML